MHWKFHNYVLLVNSEYQYKTIQLSKYFYVILFTLMCHMLKAVAVRWKATSNVSPGIHIQSFPVIVNSATKCVPRQSHIILTVSPWSWNHPHWGAKGEIFRFVVVNISSLILGLSIDWSQYHKRQYYEWFTYYGLTIAIKTNLPIAYLPDNKTAAPDLAIYIHNKHYSTYITQSLNHTQTQLVTCETI